MTDGGRGSTHHHPDLMTKADAHRTEDRLTNELAKIEKAVDQLTMRVTLMIGGLTLVALLLPIIAPILRTMVGISND